MAITWNVFAMRVALRVEYPKSDDIAAIVSTSYYMIPYGRNDIGQLDTFSSHFD